MADAGALENDLSFNKKIIAGDDDEVMKAWMLQDDIVQDDYLNCLFEKEPHHLFNKGALILPTMASTSAVPPFPSSSSSSSPSFSFAHFSRLDGEAKSLLQGADSGQQPKINAHHESRSIAVSDVDMGMLSSMGSNAGLAHRDHHSQISLCVRKNLPSSGNSSDSSMKTQNMSMAYPLTVERNPEVDGKCSLRKNIGSTKRNRVPEDHNKYEKRRRDKINEKMRTLQQLIPYSSKSNKSSILDEAIEYMKYLQFQIQYMSMQSGMSLMPIMLFTGMQAPKPYHHLPYLQHVGMGSALEGMDMATRFGIGIGNPLSHMENMPTIHEQKIASLQMCSNCSVTNSAKFYQGIQSPTTLKTSYGIEFPPSQHHEQ